MKNYMDNYQDPRIRLTSLWKNIFQLIQNENYAGTIIDALFAIKSSVKLTRQEFFSVHAAYDNKLLCGAAGFRIKGEDTEGTMFFTDIIFKHWDTLVIYLTTEIRELADKGYRDDEI